MALRVAPTTISSMAFRSFRFFFHAKREERERERSFSRVIFVKFLSYVKCLWMKRNKEMELYSRYASPCMSTELERLANGTRQ